MQKPIAQEKSLLHLVPSGHSLAEVVKVAHAIYEHLEEIMFSFIAHTPCRAQRAKVKAQLRIMKYVMLLGLEWCLLKDFSEQASMIL